MNTFGWLRSLFLLSLLAGLALAPAVPAQAGGVVTDCTESGLAAALAAGGGITFDCGGPTTIDITSPMVMSESATVDGGDTIELTGRGNTRLFEVPSGVTLRLEHIVLDGGYSGASDGGAIRSDGVLILDSSLIQNSRTDDNHSGGAIFSSGPVTITNSTLKFNGAGSGGALFANYGNAVVTIRDSTLNNNQTNNTTTGYGGAIWMGSEASLAMTDSGLVANVARSGAGLYLSAEAGITLTGTTLSGNSATVNGGGIDNEGGTATLTNVTLSGNSARFGVGGIYNNGGTAILTLTNVTLSGNSAGDGDGGGIFNSGGTATLTNVTMSGNSGGEGGGIGNYQGTATLTNVTLSGNSAGDAFGGGIFNDDATATLTNVTLSSNSAAVSGGGIYNFGGTATLTNVTLTGNSARDGGGIYEESENNAASQVLLKNTIIAFGAAGANCYRDTTGVGTIISNGYNLSSDATCAPYLSEAGDLANENPDLGPLADNGGPTLTQMPSLPSKAIDAIPNGTNGCGTTLTTDQRGVARPYHNRCDIGAVEATWPYPQLWLPLVRR